MELNVEVILKFISGIFFFNYILACDDTDAIPTDGKHYDSNEGVPEGMELFQYHPVKVGHVRYIEVEPGRYVQMKTLAMHPPIFEIPNFLTREECAYIRKKASENGLETSRTVYKGSLPNTEDLPMTSENYSHNYNETFWNEKIDLCDANGDHLLDQDEAIQCLPNFRRQNVTAAMLDLMMGDLELDSDSDARFDAKEMWRTSELPSVADDVRRWLEKWRNDGDVGRVVKRWKGRTRVSDQTWIDSNTDVGHTLQKIQDRVIALTRLHPEIIQTSEIMQVVRYRAGGHYHAHYDSNEVTSDLECRHTAITFNQSRNSPFHEDRCRYCRMVTILYYLNDVDQGGETAFPFADVHPGSAEYEAKLVYDYTDLTDHCHNSSLVVKPQLGKAIMWYNHNLDHKTGWMGSSRGHSLHGGCEVTRGVKWIANNWISVDNDYDRQQRYMDRLRPFLRAPSVHSKVGMQQRTYTNQDKLQSFQESHRTTCNTSSNKLKTNALRNKESVGTLCTQETPPDES